MSLGHWFPMGQRTLQRPPLPLVKLKKKKGGGGYGGGCTRLLELVKLFVWVVSSSHPTAAPEWFGNSSCQVHVRVELWFIWKIEKSAMGSLLVCSGWGVYLHWDYLCKKKCSFLYWVINRDLFEIYIYISKYRLTYACAHIYWKYVYLRLAAPLSCQVHSHVPEHCINILFYI